MTRSRFESEARRLRPVLLRAAVSITGNVEDAADVVQEAFLKLWFMRDRLVEYASVDAPARVIVRNLSLNVLRKRHPSHSDIDLLSDIPYEETDKELSDKLSLALESLPDTEQAVLRMKHLEGMETDEIAGLIQSTPGAVRTALSRARRHIRELYFRNL
ncbi:MAG: RNA polymerase sigma factor [Muribaculaceae bacterium]|jgi:RNA polymerase sigma-70 factor (ECF subfamily)|nr:RNA polymerase sigma factor [Muribaculaceae bacterium]